MATDLAENPFFKAWKCAILVSLSTTTYIAVNPVEEGRLIMKSIDISDQGSVGIGEG